MTQTYHASTSETAIRARDILEKRIADGRASAGRTYEHVMASAPADAIVRGKALSFRLDPDQGDTLQVVFGDRPYAVHHHALGQMCAKAGLPGAFIKELLFASEPWKRDDAVKLLNDHFQLAQADRRVDTSEQRHLVRSISGQVRGFLSDKYRRLDSRPLVEAFAGECQRVGAVPIEGVVTDTRVSLKALLPHVFEPIPGEVLCLGGEWSNSDFGAGKHAFRAFIYRLWCLNGATMEDALSQVHLGGRLAEDIEFSERTYRLDTATAVSALQDTVRGVLAPPRVEELLGAIRNAHEKQIDWKHLNTRLAKTLLKEELRAAKDAFESQDVVNLPPVQSMWRASNAISWIANREGVGAERRAELQRLAGELVNGKVDTAAEAA